MDQLQRTTWRRYAHVALIAGIVLTVVLGGMSLFKLALYERQDHAPRLRQAISKTVEVPEQVFRVLGTEVRFGPDRGTLTYVGYRYNGDKWGFFDLEVRLERGKGTGLSPSEVGRVEVVKDP